MQSVWPDSFVEDSNLTFTISVLRKALGDGKFIQTVPKRGYRFIGEIRTPEVRIIDDQNQGASPVAGPSIEAKTPPWKKERSLYAALAIVCIVGLAGLVYGVYRMASLALAPRYTTGLDVTRLTSSGNVRFAAAEPTGKYIAYVEEEGPRQSFWLKNVANGSNLQIALPENAERVSSITFSPDGNSLFFGASGGLYQVPVLGGPTIKVMDDYLGVGQPNAITFSPDGKQFAFLRNLKESPGTTALVVSSIDGKNQRNMAVSQRPEVFLRSASWSPDGEFVACVVLNLSGSQEIALIRVFDGAVSKVPGYSTDAIRQVVWRPDGRGLLAVVVNDSELGSQIWAISPASGEARRLSNDLQDYRNLSITAHPSKIVAVRTEQESHLWVTDVTQLDTAKQITSGFQKFDGVSGISWTDDGRIIYDSSPNGKPEVWLVNGDGTGRQQIADDGGTSKASPEGKFLVYRSMMVLVRVCFDLIGKNGTRFDLPRETISIQRIADGKWIVFTRIADDVGLWKVPLTGATPSN